MSSTGSESPPPGAVPPPEAPLPPEAPPPEPAVGRTLASRIVRGIRFLVRSLVVLVVAAILALAGLGVYFLNQRFELPVQDAVIRAVGELRTDVPGAEQLGRKTDYLYGERLGEVRFRRPGNSLGSALREPGPTDPRYELRDGQGELLARVRRVVPGDDVASLAATAFRSPPESCEEVEVAGGDGTLRGRLSVVGPAQDTSRALSTYFYARGPEGLSPVRVVSSRRGPLGLTLHAGTELGSLRGGKERERVFETAEVGGVSRLPHGSYLRFVEPPPGLVARWLGRGEASLRFRVRASWSLVPWGLWAGGYLIEDEVGELARVRIQSFLIRYRGQTVYEYQVDLDGNGRLDPETETIERVIVSRRKRPEPGQELLEVAFLTGTARLEALEALKLGDAVEAFLPDAVRRGFGAHSDLGLVELVRDEGLALLEPTPQRVAAILGPVDVLRSPQGWTELVRAGKRAYLDGMNEALGRRLSEVRFGGDSRPTGPTSESGPELEAPLFPLAGPGAGVLPGVSLPEREARLLLHAESLLGFGRSMWSGFGEVAPPVVLVGEDEEWLIRHPRPPEGFVSQGVHPVLGTEVWGRPRSFSPSMRAAFPLGGCATVVLGLPGGTGLTVPRWALTYVHEAFHVYQLDSGELERTARLAHLARGDATGMWQLVYPFPYADPAVLQALGLLGTALDRAINLTGAREAGGGGGVEPLRAVLGAFGAARGLVAPDDFDYMQFVAWKEGVARHVELRVAALAAAADTMPPEPASPAPYVEASKELEQELHQGLLGVSGGRASRETFYSTGAATARLLDERSAAWRGRYLNPDTTLELLLAEAVPGSQALLGATPAPSGAVEPTPPPL